MIQEVWIAEERDQWLAKAAQSKFAREGDEVRDFRYELDDRLDEADNPVVPDTAGGRDMDAYRKFMHLNADEVVREVS